MSSSIACGEDDTRSRTPTTTTRSSSYATTGQGKRQGIPKKRKMAIPLEKLPSVVEEKENRRIVADRAWGKKSGLGKVFYAHDSDLAASPVSLGLYCLRSAKEAGPIPPSIAEPVQVSNGEEGERIHDDSENNQSTARNGEGHHPGGEEGGVGYPEKEEGKTNEDLDKEVTRTNTTSGGSAEGEKKKKENTQSEQDKKSPQRGGRLPPRTRIDGEVPRASTALDGYTTTYVSSGGVHYTEDGEPVLRFFAYDKEERERRRRDAQTPAQRYSEALPQHRQHYDKEGRRIHHRDSVHQQQQAKNNVVNNNQRQGGIGGGERQLSAPLNAVLAARRPYAEYDALGVLEDAATEQKLLPPMHISFTPCPSQFNATSVRERRQQQSRGAGVSTSSSCSSPHNISAASPPQIVMATKPQRSTSGGRNADNSTTTLERSSSGRIRKLSVVTAPKGGKIESSLGGLLREKTTRRVTSYQHAEVVNVLKAKRTTGASHLGKVLQKVEGRYQQTLVPLTANDSQRMMAELQSYQASEQDARRQADLDHLKRFGVQRQRGSGVYQSSQGDSTFDLQVTSGAGGGVKPTIHRLKRKY